MEILVDIQFMEWSLLEAEVLVVQHQLLLLTQLWAAQAVEET
jgi:hypothetical protein